MAAVLRHLKEGAAPCHGWITTKGSHSCRGNYYSNLLKAPLDYSFYVFLLWINQEFVGLSTSITTHRDQEPPRGRNVLWSVTLGPFDFGYRNDIIQPVVGGMLRIRSLE